MAHKTELKVAGISALLTNSSHVWVVGTDSDAKLLEVNNMGAVAVVLSNGDTVANWTAAKGTGDWSPENVTFQLKGKKVFIAFDPALAVQNNTQKFVKELKNTIRALGGHAEDMVIPAGESLAQFANGAGSQDALLERITAAQKKASVSDNADMFSGESEEGPSESELIYMLAEEHFDLCWSENDGAFLTLKNGPRLAYKLSGGTPNLKNYLIREYRKKTGKVPMRASITDALTAIEADCEVSELRTVRLALRAARSASTGTVWIDLGRMDGLCVRMADGGWTTTREVDDDVYFHRNESVGELPVPTPCDPAAAKDILLRGLRPAFNISDDEFYLVAAWMANQIIPDWKAPIAMFFGESGSGKTTATATLLNVLEGGEDNGDIMPQNADDIAVNISKEKISLWNNVSSVSETLADNICQYIDGTSYKKRKLRTDSDQVRLKLEPSILLNGISFDAAVRGDMSDRSIVFNMGVMVTTGGSVDDVIKRVTDHHPEILGAVYTMTAHLMAHAPSVEMPLGNLRMASYVRSVIALDTLWNLDGLAFNRYMQSFTDMSRESLEDPMFKVLHRLVVTGANLREDGTYYRVFENQELLTLLKEEGSYQMMELRIRDTRSVSAYISRHITDWKKFGLTYRNHQDVKSFGARGTYKEFTFDPTRNHGAWDDHKQVLAKQRF